MSGGCYTSARIGALSGGNKSVRPKKSSNGVTSKKTRPQTQVTSDAGPAPRPNATSLRETTLRCNLDTPGVAGCVDIPIIKPWRRVRCSHNRRPAMSDVSPCQPAAAFKFNPAGARHPMELRSCYITVGTEVGRIRGATLRFAYELLSACSRLKNRKARRQPGFWDRKV